MRCVMISQSKYILPWFNVRGSRKPRKPTNENLETAASRSSALVKALWKFRAFFGIEASMRGIDYHWQAAKMSLRLCGLDKLDKGDKKK